MHEMHLIKDLFNDLIDHGKEAEAKKINKVYIRMGDFTEINPEILEFYFKENSKGTVAEGAELSIESSPTRELRLVSFDCD